MYESLVYVTTQQGAGKVANKVYLRGITSSVALMKALENEKLRVIKL